MAALRSFAPGVPEWGGILLAEFGLTAAAAALAARAAWRGSGVADLVCPACGYPAAASAADCGRCTECGKETGAAATLRRRRRARRALGGVAAVTGAGVVVAAVVAAGRQPHPTGASARWPGVYDSLPVDHAFSARVGYVMELRWADRVGFIVPVYGEVPGKRFGKAVVALAWLDATTRSSPPGEWTRRTMTQPVSPGDPAQLQVKMDFEPDRFVIMSVNFTWPNAPAGTDGRAGTRRLLRHGAHVKGALVDIRRHDPRGPLPGPVAAARVDLEARLRGMGLEVVPFEEFEDTVPVEE